MTTRNQPIVDWIEIESSAPGKFIISGEYSVVYDKQSVAAAIDFRTHVLIRPYKEPKVRVNFKNLDIIWEWPTTALSLYRLVSKFSECLEFNECMPKKLAHLLHTRYNNSPKANTSQGAGGSSKTMNETSKKAEDSAMAFLLLYIGLGDSFASAFRLPIDVEVESTVPVGSGLGSSSALSVALCGALMRVFRVAAERYVISNWAFNIDKFFHGRPSGVDNTVSTHGGCILFQYNRIKATGVAHKSPIRAMLIDTGVSRKTKALCESVSNMMQNEPDRIEEIFTRINEITSHIWRRINDPDFEPRSISGFLRANQELLNDLGVGHEKLDDICTRASNFNLTAKQTGAGGGGMAFVLYDISDNCAHISQLRENLIEAGYTVSDHTIGCEGLKVKVVPDPNW